MNLICKNLALATTVYFMFAGPSLATTVGAGGSVSVFWNLDNAVDADGNSVDGSNSVLFSGLSSLSTSSFVNVENGISSATNSSVYSFSNTSSDITIYWSASLQALTNAGANSSNIALGSYYFDSNSFVTVGNISSFSSTNGSPTCSNNNPLSPNFDCYGYSQGFVDSAYDYVYGILFPGDVFSFDLSVQSFATTRFTPVSAVPLPASGVLLGFAMLGLSAARKRRHSQY